MRTTRCDLCNENMQFEDDPQLPAIELNGIVFRVDVRARAVAIERSTALSRLPEDVCYNCTLKIATEAIKQTPKEN